MTNFSSTLQRVLAEFADKIPKDMKWGVEVCAADQEKIERYFKSLVFQKRVETALTESLKDFSAAIEVEKKICLMCGVITSAREHMDFPDHAAYEVGFNAALQAIEAKVKAYMGQ